MKIAGCIIQKRNIKLNTSDSFYASYKGKRIYVSSNHGFGKIVSSIYSTKEDAIKNSMDNRTTTIKIEWEE